MMTAQLTSNSDVNRATGRAAGTGLRLTSL
jgi:hypothetical protein